MIAARKWLLGLLLITVCSHPLFASEKMKVAVVEFDVKGDLGIPDAGSIIAEWMIKSLDATRQFDLKERVLLKKVLDEQQFEASGLIDEKTVAAKIGKLYGVEGLVTGSVIKWGDSISVTARIIDTKTGAILRTTEDSTNNAYDMQNIISKLSLVISGLDIYKSPVAYIPEIKSKVTKMRFFEGGFSPPPRAQRRYLTQFQQRKSRYINWELNMGFPAKDKVIEFDIIQVWTTPDGAVHVYVYDKANIQPGWYTSYYSQSIGSTTPGSFAVGSYRVDLYIFGRKVASGSFTVY